MCCSRNEQALLARPAADATLATRDLPGSDPAHGCHGAAPRRYPGSGHAVRLAIPAVGNRRPTAGLAPCFVQMISPSFRPPTSDFWRRYPRTHEIPGRAHTALQGRRPGPFILQDPLRSLVRMTERG